MFKIKFKNTYYGVSFSFFLVLALTLICTPAQTDRILTALMCCAFHEIGHLLLMSAFGQKPREIVIYGGGIRITPDSSRLLSSGKDIAILLAGCAVNFLLAAISYCAAGMSFFCEVNIMLGALNMLPFKYFDGGRVLEAIMKNERAHDLLRAAFIFLAAVVIIQMNLNGMVSVSFIATFCFVAISEILY